MEKWVRILLFFIADLHAVSMLHGQSIKGRITGEKGEAVVSATLFVKELKQGTAADENGYYELALPAGTYTCIFRSIGYETVTRSIATGSGTTACDIVMKEKTYEIREVVISNKDEDPACNIMRRAIAMAPYYLNHISKYKAELYVKGSVHAVKISPLARSMAREELEGIREGNTYMEESVSEMEFTAPNKYKQKVLKKTGNMPDRNKTDGALRMITVSVYDPESVLPYISPLSPGAFAHYRFVYEGFIEEGNRIINKIRVIPAHKAKQLLAGYIYIADDFWNVHTVDLSGEFVIGGIFRIQVNFGEVGENVWLPVGHRIDFSGSILGNKGDFRYVSSVKYGDIAENTSLAKPNVLQLAERRRKQARQQTAPSGQPSASAAKNKNSRKIEELLSEETLSNREAYKLSRLMRKETEEKKNGRESLNLTDTYYEDYKVETDSNAHRRDTAYWDRVRPVPLTVDEVKGYREAELSLASRDTLSRRSGRANKPLRQIAAFAKGGTLPLGKTGGTLEYLGTKRLKLGFNTVDGFFIGQKLEYYRDFTPNRREKRLTVAPEVVWAINRKTLMWSVDAGLTYAPMQRGYAELSFGNKSFDFAGTQGIYPLENTFTSLVFRNNRMKLYEEKFVKAGNTTDIVNGLQLRADLHYARRKALENSSDFSFFYRSSRDYSPNIPEHDDFAGHFTDHTHVAFSVHLNYTPRFYYRIDKSRRKRMVGSDFPTLLAGWKKGVKGALGSHSDFDLLTAGVTQRVKTGVMQQLQYTVHGGMFVNRKKIFFPDFKHFRTLEILTVDPSDLPGFNLPDYYRNSASDRYLEVHVKFTTPYLALKYLPFFNNRLWSEELQIDCLHTPQLKNYVELGYSIGLFLRAGIYVGFERLKYRSVGVRIFFPLFR
ncbi:MAG: DUF5686 and carboxypeptidase regulatory-like domain-containing protein [Bacteroidales bacterium]|jgi:hypothetical protein|nr:DUF5686 and carboxypeptidase regulatory-like domain-containing protein [Bacteroidales bacterium]